ncbi:MAG TPA: tail fiber domain-containing protein [Pyrinomonadaceae bacterium]|nr:tail fiber domain-containing protein [Pyrinomonadaceae bacterium]
MADGSYLCVVTVEDLQGRPARRLSAVTIQSGRASVKKDGEDSLKAEYAQALAAAGQQSQADASAAAAPKKTQALTVTAHDGQNGQVTSTAGALTFRTGDVFAGRDREQMRVTPEGQVGIGTDKPEATLDVAGTIRARGGIQFEDGTVLRSAADLKPQFGVAAGTNSVVVNGSQALSAAASTGTQNRLAKWLDNSGTLADSLLSESGQVVQFNGSGLQLTAAPSSQLDTNLIYLNSTSGTTGFLAGSTPSFGAANGPFFALRGNTYATVANQRGLFAISAGNVANPQGDDGSIKFNTGNDQLRVVIRPTGNVGVGTASPTQKLEVAGNLKISGNGNGLMFPDGSVQTTAATGGSMTGTAIVNAVNDAATAGTINDNRLSPNVARLGAQNAWTGQNTFVNGLSANGTNIVNVANPVSATDAANKAYVDGGFVKFAPGAEQLSVGDANGTAAMINLRGGSTCCSGPGGHTPAWFKVFQNGSFVATGNLGIGVSPWQGKGYRTSWDSYKGAFRSGYADAEWDDANVGFFSWAGGSNSTAVGLYALAFGDTNSAESTSSIVFGSGNQVKGAAGFSAGAGNRVCDTYGVAFGNKAQSGGPLVNGRCDPDSFNIRGLAAIAMGYNVTADQDHTIAFGKFASNNGFTGTFIWSDGSATASADTFRNTANNQFAARATGGFRFRTNLAGTTGCDLPAGSGVFNCTSTRTTKENFAGVNGDDVLASLRKVPVSTWNYISEGQQSRHLGPMAEDFYGAFRLGTSDKTIGVQDAVGVSLAAVKALDARTLELQKKTEEVEQLRAKVNSLEQRLAALEQLIRQNATQQGAGQK